MKIYWLLILSFCFSPLFLLADDIEDIDLLVERANQIVARMHELQKLLGEEPGARGVDLSTTELGGEVSLTRNLKLGDRDASTGGEVSLLQRFLYNQYYYDGTISGSFGADTRLAVIDLQRENKQYLRISEPTGIVGAATRELIRRISLGETLDDSIAGEEEVDQGTKLVVAKPRPQRTINIIPNGKFAGNILKPIEMSFTAYGGIGGYSWQVSGALPSGLSRKIDGDRLVISGSPKDSGDFPINIKAVDPEGFNYTLKTSIIIGPEIIEPVIISRPSPSLEWLRGSYETVRWRGPLSGTFDLYLNYYATACPNGICNNLNISDRRLIARSVSGPMYSWLVGNVIGESTLKNPQSFTISVCETRTGTCDLSGGFRIVDRASDLTFSLLTDRFVYNSGETVVTTFRVTSKTSLRKVLVFPTGCQQRLRLFDSTGERTVFDSTNEEFCTQAETEVTVSPFGTFTWSGEIKLPPLSPGVYLIKADLGAGREAQSKITVR